MLTMETGTSTSCEQLSSSPAPTEVTDLHLTTTTFSDIHILADSTRNNNSQMSSQQTTAPVKSTMNPPVTCPVPNAIHRGPINIQNGMYVPAPVQSINTYLLQNLKSNCDYVPRKTMNTQAFKCNKPASVVLQNQSMQYISHDSADGLKTAFHSASSFSFSNSHIPDENTNSDQYMFSSPSQDFTYKFPKSYSLPADYEMQRCIQGTTNASSSTLVARDLNLGHHHSMSYEHSSCSATRNSMVADTIFHGLARNIAPCPTRSLLPPVTTRQNHPPIVSDAPDSQPNKPNTLTREGSVSGYSSSRVSHFGSEDTHVSVNHQSFAQSYASLTSWTSKLTAPGYVPLPVPAPDAMPIPLEHCREKNIVCMPPPTQKINAKSWNTRPHNIYSHIKPNLVLGCDGDNLTNNKTRNGYCSGALHTSRPGVKVLPNKEHRFRRTAEALQKSGLWEVAMKTGNLMKRNRELQKDLEEFRSDAVAFLKSVIKDPQNRAFIKNVLNTALTSNAVSRNSTALMTVVVSAVAAAASSRFDSSSASDGCSSGDSSS